MSVSNYKELKAHVGHDITCVSYGDDNVAIECEDCNEVLLDFDNEDNIVNVDDLGESIVNQIDNEDLTAVELTARANFIIEQLTHSDEFYDLITEINKKYKEV